MGLDEFLEVKSLVMRIGRTRAPWVKTALTRKSANGQQTHNGRNHMRRYFGKTMTAAAALVMTTRHGAGRGCRSAALVDHRAVRRRR